MNSLKIYMSPAEKFMMEFDGSSKDLKGLFRTPKEFLATGSLHQQICNTSKNQFNLEPRDKALLDCNLLKTNKLEIGFPELMDDTKQKKYQNLSMV